MSLPTAKARTDLWLRNSLELSTSRIGTLVTMALGTSMPMVELFPGTAATWTDVTPSASAISSCRDVILLIFTPGLSSISYRVTAGPRTTLLILLSTPKLSSVSSSRRTFVRISSVLSSLEDWASASIVMGGY